MQLRALCSLVTSLLALSAHQITLAGLCSLLPGCIGYRSLEVFAAVLQSNDQLLKNIPRSHCLHGGSHRLYTLLLLQLDLFTNLVLCLLASW